MIVPVPEPDEVTAPWWEGTRRHQLLLQSCRCGHRQHPPRAVCTACGDIDHLDWMTAEGRGTVDACTVVHRPPSREFVAPYVVARVRLVEGPVVLSNVVTRDVDAVGIGDVVLVDWRPLPDGRALPVFVPRTKES